MNTIDTKTTPFLKAKMGEFLHSKRYWLIVILFWALIGTISSVCRIHTYKNDAHQRVEARAKVLIQTIFTAHMYKPQNALLVNKTFDNSFIKNLNFDHDNPSDIILANTTYRIITTFPNQYRHTSSNQEKEILRKPDIVSNGLLQFNLYNEPSIANYIKPIITTKSCLACHSEGIYKPGESQLGIAIMFPTDDISSPYRHHLASNIITDAILALCLALISIFVLIKLRSYNFKFEHTALQIMQHEKMASLGMMVAGFSHELNTPLGIATGATLQITKTTKEIEKLFEHDEIDLDEVVEPLSVLRESSELVNRHINNAHDMIKRFKVTVSDISIESKKTFMFYDLFEDIKIDMRHMYKNSNVRFDITCPPKLGMYGSVSTIKQIMYNLYSNAIKHAFLDGTLEGTISINCKLVGGYVKIDFYDDGCGMDNHTVKHLFEPFFTTGRNSSGGMGLGMFIVYNLVTTNLAGSIECDSSPGKGARFEILLPYHPPQ